MKGRILIVDDDSEMRALLKDFFENEGFQVNTHDLASKAIQDPELISGKVDVVISDIKMPQMDGFTFAEKLKPIAPDTPVILITAFGSIESAIQAMRLGAYDYVVKPFKLAEISVTVDRAIEFRRLTQHNLILRQEVKKSFSLGNLIGKSVAMQQVFELVKKVAHANSSVLINGESGTGKEMIARAIHENSPRAGKPFIPINCTAIPENLLESELFGHAKGSFTGAIQRKMGLFEQADGGTLFLDEIGDMNTSLQAKILRVLQERKIRAVGDNIEKEINVRIIAATHKDLKSAIREGIFREDLYYRLSVIPIVIPPLRQRVEDIPILAEHFLKKYAAANSSKVSGFTKAATAKLMGMKWEGNVRELENIIERAVVLSTGLLIEEGDIPSTEASTPEEFFYKSTADFPTLEQLERRYIELILEKTAGRKEKASQILGINRRTLYRKQKEYNLNTGGSDDDGISDDESQDL